MASAGSVSAASVVCALNRPGFAAEDLQDLLSEYFYDGASVNCDKDDSDSDSDGQELDPVELVEENEDFCMVKVEYASEQCLADCADFAKNAGQLDKKGEKAFQCSCKLNNDQPCSLLFTPVELQDLRFQHQALHHDELDLIVLSQIQSGIHDTKNTLRPKQKGQTERVRVRMDYSHKRFKICRDTFMFIHGIFKERLCNLISHYKEHGVVPRQHGNSKRQPKHALSHDDRVFVVSFIRNFAEEHGILLPGRVPGYARDDLKLLPASCTKAFVYQHYVQAATAANIRVIAERTFGEIWSKSCPDILPMKPSTDLCWTCQRNATKLGRLANLSVQEKLQVIEEAQQHVAHAAAERAEYNRIKQKAKDAALGQDLKLSEAGADNTECSRDLFTAYAFDFAQQVHYPANPQQPGPIYFKTPRKCGVFGVMAEALPQMALFLLDEAVETGKGANTVISLLDYFFLNMGLKETECHLYADNCTGQNKNNAMLQYLLWRVITGRHKKITLSFLVAGHTKFSPDWGFGMFKRRLRRTKVDCLEDISRVAKDCSSSGIIVPQLCGSQAGEVIVTTRDWAGFLDTWFRKLVGLKKFHHFEFRASGEVLVKLSCDSDQQVINLLKGPEKPGNALPPIIKPAGLSLQRQQYLHQEIREFCSEEHRDTVCPAPSAAKPSCSSTADVFDLRPPATPPAETEKRKVGRPKKKARGLAAKKSAV